MSGPVLPIINDHFAPLLEGQNAMSIEKHWDLMRRASSPYGTHGLASYAISAVDNALWDLKGKLIGRPVYELLGGPVKDRIFCYASNTMLTYGTENYIEWFLELGFKAVKLFVRHGPEDGIEGLRKNEELVARTREQVGPDVEIAVDSWMSLNTEYIVRLVEAREAIPDQVAGGLPPARGPRQLHEGTSACTGTDSRHRRTLVHDPPICPGGRTGSCGHSAT